MELLLNLVWLLLALSATVAGWMAGSARGVRRWRRSLLVACISLLICAWLGLLRQTELAGGRMGMGTCS